MIKLSQLTTDEFLNKTCDLLPHVVMISQDKELVSTFTDKVVRTKDMTEDEAKKIAMDKAIEKIIKLIPLLLKKHRESVYEILAIMSDKTIEAIATQNAFVTFKEIKELIQDEDFKQLFLELTA